ncbi:MAG: hypothetical protein HQL07_03175 [Nitrospirae bacterium]|nr:hypothetical protein [Magnetococcales bacterium]
MIARGVGGFRRNRSDPPPTLKLLKEKRGLGDCPQGFAFVFDFKQKGFHASLLTLFSIFEQKGFQL